MSFLTERKLANTLDLPINLPSTAIKMADWVLISTVKLVAPMRLTYRMLHLNFISSNFLLDKTRSQNKINPNYGYCYVGMYANYVSGDPGALSCLKAVVAGDLGVFSFSGNPLVITAPGTYSWIAVNNIQYSDQNALVSNTDSVDFKLSATGQCRIELDLSQ